VQPLALSVFDDDSLWLEVTAAGVVMGPRTQLSSVPFALRTAVADRVPLTTGAPSAATCDTPGEYGQLRVDPSASGSALWTCLANGWTPVTLGKTLMGSGAAADAYGYDDGSYAATCSAYLTGPGYTGQGDGVYTVKPGATAFPVYCDMTTDSGGWAIIQYGGYAGPSEADYGNPLVLSANQALASASVNALLAASTDRQVRVHLNANPAQYAYWELQPGFNYQKGGFSAGNARFRYQASAWSGVFTLAAGNANRAALGTDGCVEAVCNVHYCVTSRNDGQGSACLAGGDNGSLTVLLR